MSDSELRDRYRRYLDCLNARRFDALGEFVGDAVIHNDRPLGLAGYQAMLRDDVATFPDLRFEVGLLVVDAAHVAARLDFRVTPVRPFRGFAPNGRAVAFSEHVFYRYEAGRIARVWSLIDDTALARQLGH